LTLSSPLRMVGVGWSHAPRFERWSSLCLASRKDWSPFKNGFPRFHTVLSCLLPCSPRAEIYLQPRHRGKGLRFSYFLVQTPLPCSSASKRHLTVRRRLYGGLIVRTPPLSLFFAPPLVLQSIQPLCHATVQIRIVPSPRKRSPQVSRDFLQRRSDGHSESARRCRPPIEAISPTRWVFRSFSRPTFPFPSTAETFTWSLFLGEKTF